jgi:hypothetical protein
MVSENNRVGKVIVFIFQLEEGVRDPHGTIGHPLLGQPSYSTVQYNYHVLFDPSSQICYFFMPTFNSNVNVGAAQGELG